MKLSVYILNYECVGKSVSLGSCQRGPYYPVSFPRSCNRSPTNRKRREKTKIWIKTVSLIWTFPASGNVGRYRLVWFWTYHRLVAVKSPLKTALIGVSIVNVELVETVTWQRICRKCYLCETPPELETVVLLHDGVHFIHSVLKGSLSFVYCPLFAVVIDTTHFCL